MPKSIRDAILIIVLIGAGAIILFGSHHNQEGGYIGKLVLTAFRPIYSVISSIHTRISGSFDDYANLFSAQSENARLKDELKSLRSQNSLLQTRQTENERLRKILELRTRFELPTIAAQVIGHDAAGWYKTLLINKGSDDGVAFDMPVIVTEGILGKVTRTGPEIAKVLMITDPSLVVDARVARTRERGLVNGSLDGTCILKYINPKSTIVVGDLVVSSGLDGIFPKNVNIGKVSKIYTSSEGMFLEALVIPEIASANLEEVLVVATQKAGFDLQSTLEGK
jgi:rod shape-determining protein MreC